MSDILALIEEARRAQSMAYAPYSHFQVGAALSLASGSNSRVITGCNVENVSYGLTICAERVAIGNAVAAGYKPGDISTCVVVASSDWCAPCGACRQVLAEFNPKMEIITVGPDSQFKRLNLSDLLPMSFSQRDLQ